MSFLMPWMLYGLGAVAVPVILHLLQRRQVVRIPFSSLRLLRAIAARTNRAARLENLILLLLRCLLFALLIVAAAQPVIRSGRRGLLRGHTPRALVLAIDRSMSMEARRGDQTRLERVKALATLVLDGLDQTDEVALIAYDEVSEPVVPELTLDHQAVRSALGDLGASLARTDCAPALQDAGRILGGSARAVRQLYLFTDNQEIGWRFDPGTVFDGEWRSRDIQLIVVRPDDQPPINAAIRGVEARPAFVAPGEIARGVASIRNFADQRREDLLRVRVEGREAARHLFAADPLEVVELPFEFRVPDFPGERARCVASIETDDLLEDNVRHFEIVKRNPPRALVVEGVSVGPEPMRSGFFLGHALEEGARVIGQDAFDEIDLGPYSVVFLADPSEFGDRSLAKIEAYIAGGGTVALFVGDRSGARALARLRDLPARALRRIEIEAGRVGTTVLDPGHPLFLNVWGAGSPFPALSLRYAMLWEPVPGARVLANCGEGIPFLIERESGEGRFLIVNASADRAWGDFPLSPAFLPLVRQIAAVAAERSVAPRSYLVGQPIPGAKALPPNETLRLHQPDGGVIELPPGDRAHLIARAEQAGFYEVRTVAGAELLRFAVNPDPVESELAPIDEARLRSIVPCEVLAGRDALELWLSGRAERVPLWPVVLLVALVVFALETVLSNLAARHRSQGEEMRIRTGRLQRRQIRAPTRLATDAALAHGEDRGGGRAGRMTSGR